MAKEMTRKTLATVLGLCMAAVCLLGVALLSVPAALIVGGAAGTAYCLFGFEV